MGVFPGSSMVEQEAVNFEVAGSSPVPGATQSPLGFFRAQKVASVSAFGVGTSPAPLLTQLLQKLDSVFYVVYRAAAGEV